ncbi:MAG: FG-GAP-like repeat-containing protein, partial [Pyrinomonadaceae bacterium]|nr:FG-GAP-like repeat-containing protein [Pyrinomonadaceae bacterium]
YSISPTSQTIAGAGGSASASVTTANGCAWTAASNAAWLTITSGASGTGNGTVNYSAAANTTTAPRSGTLTIAGQTLTVTQPVGSPTCSYSISPTLQTIAGGGGNASASVTTASGCAWTAASNAAWLTIISGANDSGSGTVAYSAAANTTTAPRSGTLTIAGQTLTVTQPVGSTGGTINVSIPANLTAPQNTTLTVPVNVSNTTGNGITSFDFRLTYDAAVLTPLTTPVVTTGTLASGFEINVNTPSAGTLIVSGFGTSPLTGSGVLLNFRFNAVGAFPACSALTLTNFGFNEGNPSVSITNGQVCVTGASISGTVNYGNATTATAVPGARLTVAGTPAVTLVTTDASGNYTLTGFGSGAYTVTPSKTFDTNNSITSFDASQISKHLVQTVTLTAQQLAAADVSGNGAVTSFDASLIAQTILEIPNASNTGTWRFTPVNRVYPTITANLTGQNYTAILMGEVSGNWTPTVPFANDFSNLQATPEQPLVDAVPVNLPIRNVGVNSEFTVPVIIGDVSGREISSFDFEVLYDSSVIEPQTQAVANTETMSSEFAVGTNIIAAGRLRVSGYSAANLAGSGTLVNLKFRAVGQTGTSSALTWNGFLFNEGNPGVIRTNGRISINNLTARAKFDFDGDGRADISVFRPHEGIWYLNNSASGFSTARFGTAGDKLVPADYDGDGKTDVAVYRGGIWYLNRSQAGFTGTAFGLADDIPQPADYDGDGKAEIAVFRPSNGTWYILNLVGNQFTAVQFGQPGDQPAAGDYDGDGKVEIAVFRPSNGTWYLSPNAATNYGAVRFGQSGDLTVPADYDGDGKTDVAVFRPSNGTWYLLRSTAGFAGIAFGFGTDKPVPADYDGDGKADIAVFRNGTWYLNRSTAGFAGIAFGASTDVPIPTAFLP